MQSGALSGDLLSCLFQTGSCAGLPYRYANAAGMEGMAQNGVVNR